MKSFFFPDVTRCIQICLKLISSPSHFSVVKLEVTDNVMTFVTSLSNVDPTLFDLIWGDPDPDKTLQYDTVVYYSP